jgi:ribonuclease P protein subunit POP4
MGITPQNIVRHELIGLSVQIKESTDPTQRGLRGKVVDETYNTLRIEAKNKELTIPKTNTIFIFTLPNGVKVKVNGKLLVGRPEDRIKKRFPRW